MTATVQRRLATTSYFDDRPDARHFVAEIGSLVVMIRENLRTYLVTDGEVWTAWRVDNQLREHRFASVAAARRSLGQVVHGEPRPTIWTRIPRAEYAVTCSVCAAVRCQPCVDEGETLRARKVNAMIVGAPWRPEPHDVEVDLSPLVHAGRITDFHHLLHGDDRSPRGRMKEQAR